MWEYKTIVIKEAKSFRGGKFNTDEIEKELNKYGSQGWELVTVATSNKDYGSSASLICIFKRQK